MMNAWKKGVLAVATGASLVTLAAPAQAEHYRYGGYRHHNNGAGAAVAGGIIGLALGAAIASSSNRDRSYRSYDDGYYREYRGRPYRGYYNDGYVRRDYRPYRGGYGYDGYHRCTTDRYYDDYRGSWTTIQRCD